MIPKISIVVPTYTRSDKLRECLRSVVEYTDLSDVEVLVVANGASKETEQIAQGYKSPVRFLWFPEPLGYPRACNEGIKASIGEYIVLLNDDAELLAQPKNDWINLLLQPMLEDKLVGLTGPLKEHDPNSGYDFLIFFCVMIRREVFNSIGLLDEIFTPYFGEDTDFSIRAEKVGWKSVRVPEHIPTRLTDIDPNTTTLEKWKHDKIHSGAFPVFHDAESTIGRLPESEDILRRNRQILRERYGNMYCACDAPEEGKTCQHGLYLWRANLIDGWFNLDEGHQLAQWVKELPKDARILEVGSWHGRSSRFIADNLPEHGQLWCCDTWVGSSGEPEMHATAKEREGDHAHQYWWCNLQPYIATGRVVPVRMHSSNAAHTIGHLIEKSEMEKFDLIFIDGDHSETGIKTDIEAWLPLLKEGGLLCGHDYYKENEGPYWVHVRQYVEAKFPDVQKTATSLWYVRPHKQKRGRVFDCFLYNDEDDVLELHLATLYDSVDRFVLVEGTLTHSGNPKPLHFDLNKEKFAKYLDKITHIVVDDYPAYKDGNEYDQAWARERHQRDSIMHGLKNCQPNDIVLIGDVDEIANPEAITNYSVNQDVCRLKQRMFYYFLNCENKEEWDWLKIAPYSEVVRLTPCGIRYPPSEAPLIENGGWHFSFLGGAQKAIQKVRDYAHREFDKPELMNVERVTQLIERGEDIFGRDLKYEFTEIDSSYPSAVKENYSELLRKGLIRVLPFPTSLSKEETTRGPESTMHKIGTVTATISTKDRYFTTLPLTISAVANQTVRPDKMKIYDDGEQRDLREFSPFNHLLAMLTEMKIEWEVLKTPRMGQVSNHQHALDNCDTDYLWRIDDDELPAPNCLEELLITFRDYGPHGGEPEKVGAVAGLVHHPGQVQPLPEFVTGAVNDVLNGYSIQWFNWNGGKREVEHLYSTFLINVKAGREVGGYPRDLSPVGHHEESWFTMSLHKAGYKLLVTPHALTWHFREPTGGIRSFQDRSMWEQDEARFREWLRDWKSGVEGRKTAILDNGIGDHYCFKTLLPKFQAKYGKPILAVCFPDVFKGEDVDLISIADAQARFGSLDQFNVYKWAWDHNWQRPLVEAFEEMYGL